MRSFPSFAPAVLLGAALAVACGGSGPEGSASGPRGLDAPDFTIAPQLETVYAVGALDGEPWETFGNVSNLAFDRDGYLYILDRDAGHVVLIDPAGSYVRTISNKGEGPGELGNPFGMVLLSGPRVAVFDFQKQGFQVFDRDGEFLESVSFDPQEGMPGGRMYAMPDDRVLSAGGIRIRMSGEGPEEPPPGRPLDLFGLDGGHETAYTAWEAPPPEREDTQELQSSGGRMRIQMQQSRAFEPELHVGVLSDGRIAVADSVGYRVKLVTPAGSVASTLERGVAPIEVTESIADAERARRLAELEEGGGPAGGGAVTITASRTGGSGGSVGIDRDAIRNMMRDRVESMLFSDAIPVIERMAVDWNDRIWVQRSALPGEEGPTDVLTPDGQYLGTIGVEGMRIPQAFGPDGLVAYIEQDELEVQRVRVARLSDDEALEGASGG